MPYVLKDGAGGIIGIYSDYSGKNIEGAIYVKNERPDEFYDLAADNSTWILNKERKTAALLDELWRSATSYVESQINAAEYAKTLTLTVNEKAIANLNWYNSVWQDYYNRSAELSGGNLEVSMDFSNNGIKPYKFWEVMAG